MAHVLSLRRKEDNLMKETRTGRLVTSAVLLALATVLSLIRVYKLPLGGSVTLLSMLPEMVFTMLGALALFRGPRTRSFLAGARS